MTDKNRQQFQESSYLSGSNADYLEDLYELYLKDPDALSAQWQQYFANLPTVAGHTGADISHADVRAELEGLARQTKSATPVVMAQADRQGSVDALIRAYQRFGHLNAKLNPLGDTFEPEVRLMPSHYQLSQQDLTQTFATRGILPEVQAPLSAIIAQLEKVYCGSVGVQFTYISDDDERHWLRDKIQKSSWQLDDVEKKIEILKELIAADTLEKYLGVKYVAQKRFSIEGLDTLVPLIRSIIHESIADKQKEVIIGMSHRGRLNVLINIMGKPPQQLFKEFEGTIADEFDTTGDVKYHLGFASSLKTPAGNINLSMAFNPSHLEHHGPIVMGLARAHEERDGYEEKREVVPIVLHGDASFAGQGIVMESFNMSQTHAYKVGGVMHIIANNQIGFTTSDPHDARSSHYCSDLSKMIEAPVFHVNAEDPEAAVMVAKLALDYRMHFKKDVVIDLIGYRRHGHNEADEPRSTQPLMYAKIRACEPTYFNYAERLMADNVCTQQQIDQWIEDYRKCLDNGNPVIEVVLPEKEGGRRWAEHLYQEWTEQVDTQVSQEKILELEAELQKIPENFELQRQIKMIMRARGKMAAGEQPLDWGFAETMAYATLLDEGVSVRFSGQDSKRGTFFHRQSALFDQKTGACYIPLQHMNDHQATFEIYDSVLSELSVLGFEYGYSTARPETLVLWEAQFGDFANGAQVIIDQFISSGWQKWRRLSGLVLLLPHGQEGMGPEHSSARLERFLQLCAQDNIQVCQPTTAAQIFHLLRRQMLRKFRKPLIVMTPKSSLRHKLAVSSLDDLSQGHFQLIIPELDDIAPELTKRVILCSGKVYYDLLAKRREEKIEDTAILRIEQLYPFPYDELTAILKHYQSATEFIWCQEEPKNQGPWFCTQHRILRCMPEGKKLAYVGRKPFAAPAPGYGGVHVKQQKALVNEALNLTPEDK